MRILPLLLVTLAGFAQPRYTEPVRTSQIQAEYSAEARAANLEGIVTVYLEIDTEGKPDNVQVIQGLGLGLDENAVEAVRRWQFKPALLSGEPTRTAQAAEIPFRLNTLPAWRIRHTAYAVVREDRGHLEPVVKPALTAYSRPDPVACTAGNALVTVKMRIGKDGVPVNVETFDVPDDTTGKAVLDAARAWRFLPATGSKKPRFADATVLLECSAEAVQPTIAPTARVGGGVTPPTVVSKIEPEYSEGARKSRLQGNVVVSLQVDTAGVATHMKITKMLGQGLDAKAMEALKTWHFKPGTKDGKPVTVFATIEVSFRLM